MRLLIIFLLLCYIIGHKCRHHDEYRINLLDQDTVEIIKRDGTKVYTNPDKITETIDLDNL